MSARNPLGDLLNLATSATTGKTRVSMRNATGCLFVLIGATSGNATVNECNAASGGTEQALAVITEYWTQNNGVWTRVTQAAASTFTAATGGLAACFISAVSMSDGFGFLDATHASGSFVYVLTGLQVKRRPANLAAVTT